MNGKIDFLHWTLKPDQVHLINPLCVLLCIPLFDAALYPILYKIGINTPLRKIGLGGIITALSFVSAAVVQYIIMVSNTLQQILYTPIPLKFKDVKTITIFVKDKIFCLHDIYSYKFQFFFSIQGKSSTLLPHETNLRIYNNLNCNVTLSSELIHGFNVESLDVFSYSYISAPNETDVLSINVDPTCQNKTSNLKQQVTIYKGKVQIMIIF